MTTVAFVPARGGSKGLPGKNLLEVDGRSLVARAVETGLAVAEIAEVVVSSDDDDILAAAEAAGAATRRRAASLAGDDVPTMDVVRDFLAMRDDIVSLVLLQPTSPLRQPADVRACLAALTDAPAAATVTASEHPVEWTFTVSAESLLEPVFSWSELTPRRQQSRTTVRLNGAVYAARAPHLRSGGQFVGPGTAAVMMPNERSVDIDEEIDLVVARAVATWRGQQ